MLIDIINNSLYGEILWLFVIFVWFIIRVFQRKIQKSLWYNNFEFWVFYNLRDLYKELWYPDFEQRAILEMKKIKEWIKKECKY